MKVLFVDHSYHKVTGSSQFLIDILSRYFDVEIFFVDPDHPEETVSLTKKSGYDIIVLWQMDFLAPFFLGCGFPTIVIPMYDGSGIMPDLHWLWSRKARFINFSRRLHDRIKGLGGESMLLKYYPESQAGSVPTNWHDDVRVFLWQRRPEHGINLHAVEKIFGDALSAVHVHNATDDAKIDAGSYVPSKGKKYRFTSSEWFASKKDYADLLANFNVFVAPRRAEGIGMGFIEAMARGMIVCAHDDATHDEYIYNGLNGILFNADALERIDLGDSANRRKLSNMAIKSVEDGHENWLNSILKIVDYVRRSSKEIAPTASLANEGFLRGLISSYYAGIPTYKAFLARNIELASELNGFNVEDTIDVDFNYNPSMRRKKLSSQITSAEDKMPWLHQNKLEANDLVKSEFLISGSTSLQDDIAWLMSDKLILGFRLDVRTTAIRKIYIEIERKTHEQTRYCVILNNTLIDASILTDQSIISIDISRKNTLIDCELYLQFEDVRPVNAPVFQNVGIKSIAFE